MPQICRCIYFGRSQANWTRQMHSCLGPLWGIYCNDFEFRVSCWLSHFGEAPPQERTDLFRKKMEVRRNAAKQHWKWIKGGTALWIVLTRQVCAVVFDFHNDNMQKADIPRECEHEWFGVQIMLRDVTRDQSPEAKSGSSNGFEMI